MKEDIADRVLSIIKEQLNVSDEGVNLNSSLVELGADSLDIVEIVMWCEETFDIILEEYEIDSVTTVGDIIRVVESKTNNQK